MLKHIIKEKKSEKVCKNIINELNKSSFDVKRKKGYDLYTRDIGLINDKRNSYIIFFNSAKSCLDMVNNQLMSEIISVPYSLQ
ncbi:hypothetical protein MXB_907 [Myxobolus squamalis]|nr:hypothetical protein MXB_907 [Myxobolus squamalis]